MLNHRRLTGILCLVGAVSLGIYSLLPVAEDYLDLGMCVDEVRGEYISPDGKSVATIFERGCGATVSGTTTMVLLRESATPLRISRGGAIKFPHSFDPHQEDDIVLILDGGQDVGLHWRSGRVLIFMDAPDEKLKSLKSWREIEIRYG